MDIINIIDTCNCGAKMTKERLDDVIFYKCQKCEETHTTSDYPVEDENTNVA